MRQACTRTAVAALFALSFATPALGDFIWFDETHSSASYGTFADLADAYRGFLGSTDGLIDFNGLAEGTPIIEIRTDSTAPYSNAAEVDDVEFNRPAVPEPSTILTLLTGAGVLGTRRWRRRRSARGLIPEWTCVPAAA